MGKTLRVPFFDYQAPFRERGGEYRAVFEDVCSRGAFILQAEVEEFEQRLAKFVGVRHAIGVGNATDGLTLALWAAGLEPGSEVLLPAHTFVATAGAVRLLGAVPVLADCGDDHVIDPVSAERLVTSRTRALIPVQLNGRVADMDALSKLAADHGLMIVEDAAQALGARYRDRGAGSFGVAAAFSFYPAKLLGAFGDAGAVVTDSDEIAEAVRLLRDHGRDRSGAVRRWGMNSRLDNLQAAILLVNLRHLRGDIERRRAIGRRYEEVLRGVPGLALPPGPDAEPDRYDVFQNYELEAASRDELRDALSCGGVGTAVQWGGRGLHQFPALGLAAKLPRTDQVFDRSLMLPMHQFLRDDEVEHVVRSVFRFTEAQAV